MDANPATDNHKVPESFNVFRGIVSLTAANTKPIFTVSVAVRLETDLGSLFFAGSRPLRRLRSLSLATDVR